VIIAHDDVQRSRNQYRTFLKPSRVRVIREFQTPQSWVRALAQPRQRMDHQCPNAETPEAISLQFQARLLLGVDLRRSSRISIFVVTLSKLFVRQGFTPLFDVRSRSKSGEPRETHCISQWNSRTRSGHSLDRRVDSGGIPRISEGPRKRREAPAKQTAYAVPLPDKANAALDRIEIPGIRLRGSLNY